MAHNFLPSTLILMLFFFGCGSEDPQLDLEILNMEDIVPATFPKQLLPKAFLEEKSDNWKLVQSVSGSFNSDNLEHQGEGDVLFNAENGENLIIDIEHGDLELELDFMVPKGSNSGIYFQGRYEIQILDSWRKENLKVEDLGSIYSDYDAERKVSSNGKAAKINASKAPGLWQHFSIVFRAPKFDEDGKKIKNAIFEKVYLNGFLIQEDVEVPAPTRAGIANNEVFTGPLMLQGDHGQVAFKNIAFKKMGFDTLTISNIKYSVYTREDFTSLPDFDGMTASKEGTCEFLDDLQDLAEQRNFFAMIFEGTLNIPRSGEYLFSSIFDDGGDVFIDGDLILENGPKDFEGQNFREIVDLEEGEHDIKVSYFQNVWGSSISLYAEGPEIPKHRFGHKFKAVEKRRVDKPIFKLATESVEVQRGYVNHKSDKKTHVLSVGHPSGVNYSYDLTESNILNIWRGEFADVSNMWSGRGNSQLLVPLNAATSLESGVPIAALNSPTSAWPVYKSEKFKNNGYVMDIDGIPTFASTYDGTKISDKLTPSTDGHLSRSINFETDEGSKNTWFKVAKGGYIRKIDEGLFDIDGSYYIKTKSSNNWKLRDSEGYSELLVPASGGSEIIYELIW